MNESQHSASIAYQNAAIKIQILKDQLRIAEQAFRGAHGKLIKAINQDRASWQGTPEKGKVIVPACCCMHPELGIERCCARCRIDRHADCVLIDANPELPQHRRFMK